MKTPYLLVLLGLFLFNILLYSQNSEWINFTNGDRVFDLLDNDPFLWIGTSGGLVKLNKNTDELTFFNRANANLPGNYIFSLAIDSSNNIWVGSKYYGIGKFDGKKCIVYNSSNSQLPIDQWNTDIEVDSMGNIWIGSLMYLSIFDGAKWKSFKTGSPISSFIAIEDIYFDRNGNSWIGATWGLGKFLKDSLIENYEGFDKGIGVIQSDTGNTIWIGTHSNGLFKYDGINWTVYDTSNSCIPSNNIYDMKFDKKGNLWMATGNGLVKFNGYSCKIFDTANSGLLENGIISLEIDKNGIIWVGLLNHGLMRFDGKDWKKYDMSNSILPINQISAIEIDNLQNIWFGTPNGLVKFNGKEWSLFNDQNSGIKNDRIFSLESCENGDIWIGAEGYNCLTHYDGINWLVFDSTNSILKVEGIGAIKTDSEGNIWLGGRGVVKYDGNSWRRYDIRNTPMTSNIISDILFDSKGNLWVGMIFYPFIQGWEGGLAKFTGSEWTIYSRANSGLPVNSVASLSIDLDDNLWIGTMKGLTKYDNDNNWKVYNTDNSGIIDNSVRDVFCSNKDTLWIGTACGLSKFVGEREWSNFQVTNSGISHNYINAINEDINGNIWIGQGSGGLSVFREGGVILSTHENNSNTIVNSFSLFQNYPNPFNPATKIQYKISSRQLVTLRVYDVLGREVAALVSEEKPAGTYEVEFNAQQTTHNTQLSSGVYFYRLQAGGFIQTKKFVLLK